MAQPNQPTPQPTPQPQPAGEQPGWLGRYVNRISNPRSVLDLLAVVPLVLVVLVVIASFGIVLAAQPFYSLVNGPVNDFMQTSLGIGLVLAATFVLLTVVLQSLLWLSRRATWLAVVLLFLVLGYLVSYFLVVAFPSEPLLDLPGRLLLAGEFTLLLAVLVCFAFYPVFLFFSFLVNRRKRKRDEYQSDLERLDRSYTNYADEMFEQVYSPSQYVLPLVLSTILLVVFWTAVIMPTGPAQVLSQLRRGNYIESTMQSFLTPKLQVPPNIVPVVSEPMPTTPPVFAPPTNPPLVASPTPLFVVPTATPTDILTDTGGLNLQGTDTPLPFPVEVLTATVPLTIANPLLDGVNRLQTTPGQSAAGMQPTIASGDSTIIEAGAAFIFAFLGAYVFVVLLLTRRYFRNDLKPAVFVQMTVRLFTATVVAVVFSIFYQKGQDVVGEGGGLLTNVALQAFLYFVIGIFPDLGLQLISSAVNGALRAGQQFFGTVFSNADRDYYTLTEPAPLHLVEGLTVWDQARLLEEGVENVQALATAPIARLFVSTSFSAQQLVDWIDQAILMLYVGAEERQAWKLLGLRTASDLMDLADRLNNDTGALANILKIGDEGRTPEGMTVLLTALQNCPNLYYVRNYWAATRPTTGERIARPLLLPAEGAQSPAEAAIAATAASNPPAVSGGVANETASTTGTTSKAAAGSRPAADSKSLDNAVNNEPPTQTAEVSRVRPDAAPANSFGDQTTQTPTNPPANPPIIFYDPTPYQSGHSTGQPSVLGFDPVSLPHTNMSLANVVELPVSKDIDRVATMPLSSFGDSLLATGVVMHDDPGDGSAVSKDIDGDGDPLAGGDSIRIRGSAID